MRIVGAGIASSPGETRFALESASPNRIGFDTVRVMRTRYRIDDYQESYFVMPGFEAMPALDETTLHSAMAQARTKADIDPAVVLPRDRLFQRGDGTHHGAAQIAS